jgi:hypothetical protein
MTEASLARFAFIVAPWVRFSLALIRAEPIWFRHRAA